MFILRRLDSGYGEINTCLGDYYILVSKEKNNDRFREIVKLWGDDDLEGVHAVITFDDGECIMPLYSNSKYYIMTSDGKTFSNISEK